MTSKTIKVDQLARVEGEGALKVVARDGVVQSAELNIFEPPRFFEAFLRDRMYTEAPDITARICGICPVAYQMSAVHAMENALGVVVQINRRTFRLFISVDDAQRFLAGVEDFDGANFSTSPRR